MNKTKIIISDELLLDFTMIYRWQVYTLKQRVTQEEHYANVGIVKQLEEIFMKLGASKKDIDEVFSSYRDTKRGFRFEPKVVTLEHKVRAEKSSFEW